MLWQILFKGNLFSFLISDYFNMTIRFLIIINLKEILGRYLLYLSTHDHFMNNGIIYYLE